MFSEALHDNFISELDAGKRRGLQRFSIEQVRFKLSFEGRDAVRYSERGVEKIPVGCSMI